MTVTYQTVRLGRGKHSSPEHGACVMELASMLAGGPFTDQPRCACPVIGAFLRSYNDWIDNRRRQDLYAYAAKVVNSRAPSDVQDARAERLMEWAEDLENRRLKRVFFWSPWWAKPLGSRPDDIASRVVCAIARQKQHPHQEALAVLDELLEMGPEPTAPAESIPRRGARWPGERSAIAAYCGVGQTDD
jgi:hypothetical protein